MRTQIYEIKLIDEEQLLGRFSSYERLMIKQNYPDMITDTLARTPYQVNKNTLPRKDILTNLRFIAVELESITSYPLIFGRKLFKQKIMRAIQTSDIRTAELYEYYLLEYAKQNKADYGFYNLAGLYETIEDSLEALNAEQRQKEVNRKQRWYDKIKTNKLLAW